MKTRCNTESVLAVLFATAVVVNAQGTYPEVTFRYSPIFDSACTKATKQQIEPEAVKELQSRLESFQELWRKDGPQLLSSVPGVTGVPFSFRETSAALVLCPGFPSMSMPLMVNMRMYLSATGKGDTAPMIDFENTLFHEILHRYVFEWIATLPARSTALLDKYKTEPRPVLNHLHLYGTERLVYRKLRREKDLDISIAAEQTWNEAAVLKRAREIVAIEGAEAFVREFRNPRR
jgi:hypothetical protein